LHEGTRGVASDFFERQAAARRSTLWLRLAFALAFVIMIGAVSLVVLVTLSVGMRVSASQVLATLQARPDVFLRFSAFVAVAMLAVAASRAWKLRAGGGALAESLGGRRVLQKTTDPAERRLLNVVEEMSLAARLPRPSVYVLDHEKSLNAFAASRKPEDAAIGITAGALAAFDRDELQALVGHEFSHLLNGDTALNTRLLAWLHGLHAPSMFAMRLLRGGNRRFDLRALAIWPLIAGLFLIGCVGTLLGRALQAMISRRREQLADASAVQYTRNPQALQSVLLKVAGCSDAAVLDARGATAAAHMMFSAVDLGWISKLGGPVFATHPPLLERVRALDPAMTEQRYRALVRAAGAEILEQRRLQTEARADSVASNAQRRAQSATGTAEPAAIPAANPATIATPRAALPGIASDALVASAVVTAAAAPLDALLHRMTRAQQLALQQFTASIGDDVAQLELLLLAALLAPEAERRTAQIHKLTGLFGADLASHLEPMLARWNQLPPVTRLPAVNVLLPQFEAAPVDARARWVRAVDAFARIVAPSDTTRFAITRVLRQRLSGGRAAAPDMPAQLPAQAEAVGILFSLLAHESGAQAQGAFRFGLQELLPPQRRPAFTPAPIDAARIDAAFADLATLHPSARRALGAALARLVSRDQGLSVGESDWLRATAILLDMPIPVLRLDLKLDAAATAR
jgi:Zn-dependent protease with chaperone function